MRGTLMRRVISQFLIELCRLRRLAGPRQLARQRELGHGGDLRVTVATGFRQGLDRPRVITQ